MGNLDDQKLIHQNLKRTSETQQVEYDNALLYKSDTSSLSAHNDQYTELLKAYVNDFIYNSSKKRENKQKLFDVSKKLLFWIPLTTILLMFVIIICLAFDKVNILEALPGLLTALTTLLGTFMIVPQMITKYLFNKKEEENLANIISKIQEYDSNIRKDL